MTPKQRAPVNYNLKFFLQAVIKFSHVAWLYGKLFSHLLI